MKPDEERDAVRMWRELESAPAVDPQPIRPNTLRADFQPGERCQLLLPGWEPITYVREDVYEVDLLRAYRNGRKYEAHAKRLLAMAMFAFGLAAASLAFLIVAEIWLH